MVRHARARLVSRRARTVALLTIAALALGLTQSPPASARPDSGPDELPPPPSRAGRSVTGVKPLPMKFTTPRDSAKSTYRPTRTAWPKPATARLSLTAPTSATMTTEPVRAANLPVWVQPLATDGRYAGPQRLDVSTADRSLTQAAGVDGLLLTVDPAPAAGTQAKSGWVRVGVDYTAFAEAYGGNYGSRLRLVRLPACVLETPHAAHCRTAEPLPSTNDAAARTVSADLPLAAGDTGTDRAGTTVLAAVASVGEEGGLAGTYAATDLKASGSWAVGGNTGSFAYSYPIALPPTRSKLVPDVSLLYDSASVDGQTVSTNAQASWVGDGWSTPRSYIEQTFAACKDNPGGQPSPVATDDRCYAGPVLTLALNGTTTSLVWDNDKEVWKLQSDTGAVVSRASGNGSGTHGNEYWRITERNGTVYEFGRNRLPGWTSGKTETKSVDHIPVYSPHSGDPCYNSAGFSASVCTMAYRWNLDYVRDVHGNAMAYYYEQDTNHYGRNRGATDVSYIRDSWLTRIDYGFTDGNAYGVAPNRVVFHTDDRCLATSCSPLTTSTKANWPDVPFDLICASGTDCDDWSPSFFSTIRLTSIETQQYDTATATHEPVDTYALTQTLPPTGDGTSPTLWLSSITRTGHDLSGGGSTAAITLPSVSFGSIKLPNRVDTAGGRPSFYRHRLETITTETGSVVTASYELPQPCAAPVSQSPASNTRSCYPVYWTPEAYPQPVLDWFNRYAATRVSATDPTGGAPATMTSYEYVGGAAWRYDENEVVKAKYRTYGQFRGYGKVRVRSGDDVNDPRTLSETTYYRGMSKNNSTSVVNVTDSAGGVHEDVDQLAGRELEITTHLGDGGGVEKSTVTAYWVSTATATRTRTGLPALTATVTAPVQVWSRQAVTTSGTTTWRYNQSDSSYDTSHTSPTFGLLKHTYDHTVPADPDYDRCTTPSYAPANTSKNLIGLVAQVEAVSVACGGFTQGSPATVPASKNTLTAPITVNRPTQVISHVRTYFDDPTFATAFPQPTPPSKGNVTMIRRAAGWNAGAYTYQTTDRADFDAYGRTTAAYDGNGNKTRTDYSDNAVGLTTGVTVTNADGHDATATISPRRNLTTVTTDANDVVTSQRYDALGRVTAVWLASRPTTSQAHVKFAYTVSKTGPTATTTEHLTIANEYLPSTTIYDALLRVRQTQNWTPNGGRLVNDTFYDSRGWVRATYNGWWDAAGPPRTTPVYADGLLKKAHHQTFNTYDGLGRVIRSDNARDGVVKSTTRTVYNGDRTTVIPPEGGTTSATVVDPLGRAEKLIQYTSAPTLHTPANPFTGIHHLSGGAVTTTRYGYNGQGLQASLIDAAGNTWTRQYDLLGQVISRDDPDNGQTTSKYDGAGNLAETTDARSETVSHTYDSLNRRTGSYAAPADGQSPATRLAAWIYDNDNLVANVTNSIGKLTTSIAYRGGAEYTTQYQGFTLFGSSTGETFTIPATEGLLGNTYFFGHTYESVLGLVRFDTYQARGNLPSESVHRGYNAYNLPSGVGGTLTGYNASTVYDAWRRVELSVLGLPSAHASITTAYDDHTGWRTQQLITKKNNAIPAPVDVEKQNYLYDQVGNIIKKTDTRYEPTTVTETQCYRYDALRRLTKAWTATDDCTATPTTSNRAMVGSGIAGSAYWTDWSVDPIGNRTEQIQRSLTGGTDITTSYAYDGNGAGQPHSLTGTSTSGGLTGSTSYTYDAAGNMVTRQAGQGAQNLAWDDSGKLASVTGGTDGDTSFVYDADGNVLIQKDPGKNTLYLPNTQITLNTSTQTLSGVRYYPLPGGATAIRTGSGTAYSFTVPDHQGTPTLYLNNTAQIPTWRQYTPYGGPRGATMTVPDNRGFLNKPLNPTTGFTQIGARNYDPTIGRFISVDPIQDLADPQQWNGYAYANNSPITFSDPSGLSYFEDAWGGGQTSPGGNGGSGKAPNVRGNRSNPYHGIQLGGTGDGRTSGGKAAKTLDDIAQLLTKKQFEYRNLDLTDKRKAMWYAFCYNSPDICSRQDAEEEKAFRKILSTLVLEITGIQDRIDCASGKFAGCAWIAAEYLPYLGRAKIPAKTGVRTGEAIIDAARLAEDLPPGVRGLCSFSADTEVLLADGSTKPIEDVGVGDEVMAANPATGELEPRPVTHLWAHQDLLLKLDTSAGSIVTTEDHPFWNVTDQAWQRADALDAGDSLLASDGSRIIVRGIPPQITRSGAAYNLTVAGTHTYYVVAGSTPVLVHNCGGPIRVSPSAQDWGTKGAHMHVGNHEVRIFPDGRGGIGAEPIRLRSGTATPEDVQRAIAEIHGNPQLRADLIDKSRSAMGSMNSGEWGMSSNRAAEMHFLIKALEGMG